MQCATERRQLILEYISDRRQVQLQNIMAEFGISRMTAIRDVQILACSYPIYTQQGGAGGIKAADGWYLSRRYLHDDQEEFLRNLMNGLQPEDQKMMESILTAFAKPQRKENTK